MEVLNLKGVFFEALSYPEYARPNFYVRKQQESGWAKGIYLTTLSEVYHACKSHIQIIFRAKRRDVPELKEEDIVIPIKEITKGNEDGTFNREIIKSLYLSVLKSYRFGEEKPTYTPIEVLSFVEYGLLFIKREFLRQTNKSTKIDFAPRTSSYFHYNVAQDAPFINFPRFKSAVRELLFFSNNRDDVKVVLKKYRRLCFEIVKIWNEKLYFIEQSAYEMHEKNIPTIVNVEFSSDELKHSWHNDPEYFDIYYPHLYTNQNFASYAAGVANQLSSDLQVGGREVSVRNSNTDFLSDFKAAIKKLLDQGNAECIRNLREGKKLEEPFRDWFDMWFDARGYKCSREALRGKGHIDLKVLTESDGEKIVEFKGWWNPKKKATVQQVCKYLTQFEGDGYIVMVNHTSRDVENGYKVIVSDKKTGFVRHSWKTVRASKGFKYFKSKHQTTTGEKEVHHFILWIH